MTLSIVPWDLTPLLTSLSTRHKLLSLSLSLTVSSLLPLLCVSCLLINSPQLPYFCDTLASVWQWSFFLLKCCIKRKPSLSKKMFPVDKGIDREVLTYSVNIHNTFSMIISLWIISWFFKFCSKFSIIFCKYFCLKLSGLFSWNFLLTSCQKISLKGNKECFPPNELSRAHWAQRQKWQEWSLYRSTPGRLCICFGCSLSILVGILTVEMPVSLILVTALETLSFIGLPWSASIGRIFTLSYCVLFCVTWSLSLGGLLLSEGKLRESRSGREGM